jgi:hypothetical protein
VWKTGEVCTGFWWRDLTERDEFKDLRADGKIILKCKGNGKGNIYLRIGHESPEGEVGV